MFAHAGTMFSTLLLPEQAVSRIPKINKTEMRAKALGSMAAEPVGRSAGKDLLIG
jgi:hypothetical protein